MSYIPFVATLVGAMLLSAGAALANPASPIDGPYAVAQGRSWVVRSAGDESAGDEAVRAGRNLHIAAVEKLPAFKVKLRAKAARPAPDALAVPVAAPLFVMTDTHGEYTIMVELLQAQKIIDKHLKWSFGRGHMVVTGDIFDRGPHQLQILWLLYKLEDEARRAGGGLHLVLGNHENMVLRGDLRYLHERHKDTAQKLGFSSYSELFGPNTLLGAWLRTKPAILKINDMLFTHGGVSPDLAASGLSLSQINQRLRASLDSPITAKSEGARQGSSEKVGTGFSPDDPANRLVSGPAGPLWYRGYFSTPGSEKYGPTLTNAEVSKALAAFGATRIFVGHTPQEHARLLFGGKVAAVHVYPHRDEAGRPIIEAAIRLNGEWQVANAQGARFPFPETE